MLAIEHRNLLIFLEVAHADDAGVLLKIEISSFVVQQLDILFADKLIVAVHILLGDLVQWDISQENWDFNTLFYLFVSKENHTYRDRMN